MLTSDKEDRQGKLEAIKRTLHNDNKSILQEGTSILKVH